MLKLADIVVITKGDIVSQAEREVFAYRVRQVNPRGIIIQINGVTGQGSLLSCKTYGKKFCNRNTSRSHTSIYHARSSMFILAAWREKNWG